MPSFRVRIGCSWLVVSSVQSTHQPASPCRHLGIRLQEANRGVELINRKANRPCSSSAHRLSRHSPHQSDETTRGQAPTPVPMSTSGLFDRHSCVVELSGHNSAFRPQAQFPQTFIKKAPLSEWLARVETETLLRFASDHPDKGAWMVSSSATSIGQDRRGRSVPGIYAPGGGKASATTSPRKSGRPPRSSRPRAANCRPQSTGSPPRCR